MDIKQKIQNILDEDFVLTDSSDGYVFLCFKVKGSKEVGKRIIPIFINDIDYKDKEVKIDVDYIIGLINSL